MRAFAWLPVIGLVAGCHVVLPLDQRPADQAAPSSDLPVLPDVRPSAVDAKRPDVRGHKPDAKSPADHLLHDKPGPSKESGVAPVACLVDSDCTLANDCCRCEALIGAIPSCTNTTCGDGLCSQWLPSPTALCVGGVCVVGDNTPCALTSCKVVNDCCFCVAVETTIPTSPCQNSNCPANTCWMLKLGNPTATCINNRCLLVP